jgi:lipopolysaccharide export system protein LptA
MSWMLFFSFFLWNFNSVCAYENKIPIDISAEQGVKFFDAKNYLEALGNVSIARGNSTLYGNQARIDYQKNNNKREMIQLNLQGNVLSVSPRVTIYAQRGQYHLPTNTVIYKGSQADPYIQLFAPEGDLISQKELRYELTKKLVTAKGSAELHSHKASHKLFAEEIRAFLKEGTTQQKKDEKKSLNKQENAGISFDQNSSEEQLAQSLDMLEAHQNVKLVLPGKVATSDHARYQVDREIIELWGHVKVTDDTKQLYGAYAIIYKNQGQSEVYATLPAHLQSKTKQKEKKKKRVKILLLPS